MHETPREELLTRILCLPPRNPIAVNYSRMNHYTSTTNSFLPSSHVRAVEVRSGISSAHTRAVITIPKSRGDGLTGFLGRSYLGLQLGGTLVDNLQLRQVRVEDADNLRNL